MITGFLSLFQSHKEIENSSLAYLVSSEPWKAKGTNSKKVDTTWEDT